VLNDEDQMRKIVVLYGHPTDADHFCHYYEDPKNFPWTMGFNQA
jgi:hypothetical protein